jgi:hypothetical protein
VETRRDHVRSPCGYLGFHHRRRVDPNFHVIGWALRRSAKLLGDHSRLLSSALAVVRFAGSGSIFKSQTIGIRA